jgi:hypothetical protein
MIDRSKSNNIIKEYFFWSKSIMLIDDKTLQISCVRQIKSDFFVV